MVTIVLPNKPLEKSDLEYYLFQSQTNNLLSFISEAFSNGDCSFNISGSYNKYTKENFEKVIKFLKENNGTLKEIVIDFEHSYLYDNKEIEDLKFFNSFAEKNNIKVNLTFNRLHFDENAFFVAKQKIEEYVEKINSMTVKTKDGKERLLSPAEKLVLINHISADRKYKMFDEKYLGEFLDMRSWIGLLTTDYAICSGYSSLFQCLCDNVFKNNEVKAVQQSCEVRKKKGDKMLGYHSRLLVYVKDNLYGLDGIYSCDPCFDSKTGDKKNTKMNNFLIPLSKVETDKIHNYKYDSSPIFKKNNILSLKKSSFSPLIDSDYYSIDNEFMKFFGYGCINDYSYDYKYAKQKYFFCLNKARENMLKHFSEQIQKLKEDDEVKEFFNYPFSLCFSDITIKEHPELQQFVNYVSSITRDTIIDKKYLKMYMKVFDEDKEFREKLEKSLKFLNFRKYKTFEDALAFSALEKEKEKDIYLKNRDSIVKKSEEEFNKNYEKYITEKAYTFTPKEIPQSLVKNGLYLIAKFNGLKFKSDIENFIKREYKEYIHTEKKVYNDFDKKKIKDSELTLQI